MPGKRSYLSLLPKTAREEVEAILRERDGGLTFPDLVARRWDLGYFESGPFSTAADWERRLGEGRATLASKHPGWTPDQVDDTIRLVRVTTGLHDIAIARRCALDDPAELDRLLTASNRLQCAAPGRPPELEEVCAAGDAPLACRLAADRTASYTAVLSRQDLHLDAVYALLRGDRGGFDRVVGQIPTVCPKPPRPWMEGVHVALKGVVDGRPGEVARGLDLHIAGLHKMREKRDLEGAVKLMAHGLYRVFEWVSPDLVAEFDATQPFPWDAPFHDWVSAHPDPVAGWNLSATPPLVQQVVGRGEIPDWLAATEPRFEVVLLGGDVGSRPLLEEVERFGGGDGSLRAARLLLANCPVVLRWGFEEAGHAAAAAARLEAVGGRAEGRAMQPGTFRHFIPPGPPTT